MDVSKIKIEWPKNSVLALIEAWEQNECLYNTKSELYHNKHARNNSLQNIARELECYIPNISPTDVKTKMSYLRTQYCRELAKIKSSNKSGCGYEEIYTPTTYWFEHLNFLRGYCNIKKGSSSVCMVVDVDKMCNSQDCESVSPASSSKKMKTAVAAPEDELLLQAKELLEKVAQPISSANSYDESLLLFLQQNLSDIRDEELKDELSEQIISLVMQYKRKQRMKDVE